MSEPHYIKCLEIVAKKWLKIERLEPTMENIKKYASDSPGNNYLFPRNGIDGFWFIKFRPNGKITIENEEPSKTVVITFSTFLKFCRQVVSPQLRLF